jgi:hypothetical protein
VCIEEWPLVKELQRKYGFEVLLWSVDSSYGSEEEAREPCADAMARHEISWPNVIVPGGWDKLKEDYKIDGYGLFLIDGEGRLLGRELFPDDVERILKESSG